ncbi:Tn3 family transposase [Streptomyces umbrinus]|uniref:Tn3 family transposase n=1 Tax=Streptomyces umbrinus TaxID=67370 RepID=UPI00340634C0
MSANKDLLYGKDGDLAGQDKESQEVSMLALHLLQSALVRVNTLLMQEVLADPKWADKLTVRRRANGETVEDIQPDLLIPTVRRKGLSPSLSSIYRALAEYEKARAYPGAVETAHADFAALQQRDRSPK